MVEVQQVQGFDKTQEVQSRLTLTPGYQTAASRQAKTAGCRCRPRAADETRADRVAVVPEVERLTMQPQLLRLSIGILDDRLAKAVRCGTRLHICKDIMRTTSYACGLHSQRHSPGL